MRRLRGALFGLLLVLSPAAALAGPAEQAQALVKETTEQVLERLEAERAELRADPRALYELIQDVVLPHFDFETMSRLVLARHWRSASEEQRERFVVQFRSLLVRTYGTALLEYTGQRIEYKAVHAAEDARRVSVPTVVVPDGGGPAIPIVYRLFRDDGPWKVYDISVDGVSLLVNYRNSYATVVRQQGLDALIARMAEKNGGTAR